MTSRTGWLLASAVAAVAVYVLMWVGYRSQWTWLTELPKKPNYNYLGPLKSLGSGQNRFGGYLAKIRQFIGRLILALGYRIAAR